MTRRRDGVGAAARAERSVARLELFDELEEWRLIMQHYCLAWAVHDAPGGGLLRVRLAARAP